MQHLPTSGQIVQFDRSWFTHAGGEHGLGVCSGREREVFMIEASAFEDHLICRGIRLLERCFSVSRDTRCKRFKHREIHTLRPWPLSPTALSDPRVPAGGGCRRMRRRHG